MHDNQCVRTHTHTHTPTHTLLHTHTMAVSTHFVVVAMVSLLLIGMFVGLVIWVAKTNTTTSSSSTSNSNSNNTSNNTSNPPGDGGDGTPTPTTTPTESGNDIDDDDDDVYHWDKWLGKQCIQACDAYNKAGGACYDEGKTNTECREWFVGDEDQPSRRVKDGDVVAVYHPHKYEGFVALVDCGSKSVDCDNKVCDDYGQYLSIQEDPQGNRDNVSKWRFQVHIERTKAKDLSVDNNYLQWGDTVRLYVKDSDNKRYYFATPSNCVARVPARDHAAVKYSKESDLDSANKWLILPWCNQCAVQRNMKYIYYGDDISITHDGDNKKVSMFAARSDPDTSGMVFAWDPNDYGGKNRRHHQRMQFRFYTKDSVKKAPKLPT